MTYLVDANLLSEPTKPISVERAVEWLDANEAELITSPVVMGEIWRGIDALPEGKKKRELVVWFDKVQARMPTLDWTTGIALIWAEMVNRVKKSGYTVGIMDTMIAATAKHHGLTVATRNVDDFTRCGVPVVNPFE
jgi:predicted nucleic acid-binding protein